MNFRLIPYSLADGPHNMAADEALLQSAEGGRASLRFYGWTEATLSLGYFQPCQARFEASGGRKPPDAWVRRPTGGATLVHHHELTYAIALPLTGGESAQAWMPRMHRIIADALPVTYEVRTWTRAESERETMHRDTLCFKQLTIGDLLCGPHKILGSSQRKHHRCLLQHGALLLAQSPFTPTLPGLKELTGLEPGIDSLMDAIIHGLQRTTGWQVRSGDWTIEELALIDWLVAEKYSQPAWNEKR